MSKRDPHGDDGPGRRRGRFRAQAWLLGAIAAAIYLCYLAFMLIKGTGAA